jgi:FtsZ-interacting cell division protein ZipA
MNKTTLIIVGIVIVALLVGGFLWKMKADKDSAAAMENKKMMNQEEMIKQENVKKDDSMMKNEGTGEIMQR